MEQIFRCIMRIPMIRWAKIHVYIYLHCASAEQLGFYKAETTVVLRNALKIIDCQPHHLPT